MLTLQECGIDVYKYLDSRRLLQAYCNACKSRDSRYSLRFFAKELGYGSPNYVTLIIEGSRNISEKKLGNFSKSMGLTGAEREYFELLVRLTQSSDVEGRNHYFQQISAIRRKKLQINQLEDAQFECITSWLHLLIREMSFLQDFSEDPHWINQQLTYKASVGEITKCLKDLEEAGLLVRKDKKLQAADLSITFPDEVRSLAIQKYHQGILSQGQVALDQSLDQREYGATVIATTPEKFQLVKEKLKKFRAEVLDLLNTKEGEANEVVVLAFQLFHAVDYHESNGSH